MELHRNNGQNSRDSAPSILRKQRRVISSCHVQQIDHIYATMTGSPFTQLASATHAVCLEYTSHVWLRYVMTVPRGS